MTPGSPEQAIQIAAGDQLVLDTSTVIAYLNASEPASDSARMVIEQLIGSERNPGWISAVTVAEVLVRPLMAERSAFEAARTFLLDFPGLSVRSADFLVAAEAAAIRASTRASLPDALIAATATVTSSRWLITNDRLLRERLTDLDWRTQVLLLSELRA